MGGKDLKTCAQSVLGTDPASVRTRKTVSKRLAWGREEYCNEKSRGVTKQPFPAIEDPKP